MKIQCAVADKDLLSVEETKAWLGVGHSILERMREDGLPAYRLGASDNSKIRFKKADILKHIEKYQV